MAETFIPPVEEQEIAGLTITITLGPIGHTLAKLKHERDGTRDSEGVLTQTIEEYYQDDCVQSIINDRGNVIGSQQDQDTLSAKTILDGDRDTESTDLEAEKVTELANIKGGA